MSRPKNAGRRVRVKASIWLLALLPVLRLSWNALQGRLGANPIEAVLHGTGWWALLLLTLTLAVTPVRRLTGWREAIRYRRLLGLFAFFYATLHVVAYVALDQFFALEFILEDVIERPFITAGAGAWAILLALAATSTRGSIRRLGRGWRRLHRLVYAAAGLAVLHYFWKEKADTLEPLLFAASIGAVLLLRLLFRQGPSRAPMSSAASPHPFASGGRRTEGVATEVRNARTFGLARLRQARFRLFVIALITAAFLAHMAMGLCPVP